MGSVAGRGNARLYIKNSKKEVEISLCRLML